MAATWLILHDMSALELSVAKGGYECGGCSSAGGSGSHAHTLRVQRNIYRCSGRLYFFSQCEDLNKLLREKLQRSYLKGVHIHISALYFWQNIFQYFKINSSCQKNPEPNVYAPLQPLYYTILKAVSCNTEQFTLHR